MQVLQYDVCEMHQCVQQAADDRCYSQLLRSLNHICTVRMVRRHGDDFVCWWWKSWNMSCTSLAVTFVALF
jgi:hypothetical protein